MSYEMLMGLVVTNGPLYAAYRKEMRPLLEQAGGAFRYDFEVAGVIHTEGATDLNRVFVLRFPDRQSKERFFADPRYLEIRRRLFEPAVATTVVISEHSQDGRATEP